MITFLYRFFIIYILALSIMTIALASYSIHASSLNNASAPQVEQAPSSSLPAVVEYSYSPQWYHLSTELTEYPMISAASR